MSVFQYNITLKEKKRGFHLITSELLHAIGDDLKVSTGICHIFVQHTSASITINENADPTVRKDFETYFSKAVRENDPDFVHDTEGSDDMPAHIKSSILGSSVSIPISDGELNFGTWQGVYLCEHRNNASARDLVVTIIGE